LGKTRDLLDRCRIQEKKLSLHCMKNDHKQAMDVGLTTLAQLGVILPAFPNSEEIQAAFSRLEQVLSEFEIQSILTLPELNDPLKLIALRILNLIGSPAYGLGSQLPILATIEVVLQSIEHGNCPVSVLSYMQLAQNLSMDPRKMETAYQFAKLAMDLHGRLHQKSDETLIYLNYGSFLYNYNGDLPATEKALIKGYYSGLENGAYQGAGYCAAVFLFIAFWGAETLPRLLERIEEILPVLERIFKPMAQYFHAVKATIANLRETRDNPFQLSHNAWPKMELVLEEAKAQNDVITLFLEATCRLCLANWFGDRQAAWRIAEEAQAYASPTGLFINTAFMLHQGLAYAAAYAQVTPEQQEQFAERITANLSELNRLAEQNPRTYHHHALLLEAGWAAARDQPLVAMDLFEQAIDESQETQFHQITALAMEAAAQLYRERGNQRIAAHYCQQAHYAYHRWGAQAKCSWLEKQYPRAFAGSDLPPSMGMNFATGPEQQKPLDLSTVMKASQTISSQIDLTKLLAELMDIIMENAGARKGFLVLESQGQLTIEARAEVGQENAVLKSKPLEGSTDLPEAIVRYVIRTGENVVLHDATVDGLFKQDPYILSQRVKSVLCTPIHHKDKQLGALYLENDLASYAFTEDRIEVLDILLAQAAISLENARLYAQMSSLNRDLEKSNKELQQFLLIAAHDLSEPLRQVFLLEDMFLEQYDALLPQDAKHSINRIQSTLGRMRDLLSDLRKLVKVSSEEKPLQAVNLKALVSDVVAHLTERVEAVDGRISIKKLPEIEAEPGQLEQLFLQLLDNSLKFAKPGFAPIVEISGRLLKTKQVPSDLPITNQYCQIVVADNGIGFDERRKDRIFQIFRRLHSNKTHAGTGIGLALCRRIVTRHHGKIDAQSTPGEGSRFHIILPLRQPRREML
jgi:signal transduction histidine kinase